MTDVPKGGYTLESWEELLDSVGLIPWTPAQVKQHLTDMLRHTAEVLERPETVLRADWTATVDKDLLPDGQEGNWARYKSGDTHINFQLTFTKSGEQPLPKMDEFPRRSVRLTDTGPDDHLALIEEVDGDVWIEVCRKQRNSAYGPMYEHTATEVCAHAGGGHSPRTLKALKELAKAIRLDNEEEPRRAAK